MKCRLSMRCAAQGLCLLVFVALSHLGISSACPRKCFCPLHSKNVYCSRKGLRNIPAGIPFDTLQLNLNENQFDYHVLSRRNMSNFESLEHLYMSNCGIKTITLDTFADLTNLKWLDISKNNIEFIADFTFRGLTLNHLFLNDNPKIQLSEKAFEGLTARGLYMHKCNQSRLSLKVMLPINGTLKSLWLDNNKFEKLSKEWLNRFSTLSHLRLGKNPFHCNCDLKWLFRFFKSHPSVFSGGDAPTCATPTSNRKKSFTAMSEDDFRCELPTFKKVDAIFGKYDRLACLATGDPTPTLFWIRPDGTTETFYPPPDEEISVNEGKILITHPHRQEKDLYRCVASNPAGNVTFSLNVAWPPEKKQPPTTEAPIIPPSTRLPPHVQNENSRNEGSYGWTANKAEKKFGVADTEVNFTIVDIVGAVVGTFLLTLLVCVIVFHFYYKRRERLKRCDEGECRNDKKRSPNNLYVMAEADENCVKMINHSSDCPS